MFSLQVAWKPTVMINRLTAMHGVLVTCGEERTLLPIPEYQAVNTWALGLNPEAKAAAGDWGGQELGHRLAGSN